ncbi:cytochrome P450 [Okeania sp. KiyG1]|uniref:cytochrome P450 n=1 Tax=Okeania sp. KiyG1 TaxID=2720165 RepID=UPI001F29EB57|nr:cytochrome P450 [Okeania sp. KiyG1]
MSKQLPPGSFGLPIVGETLSFLNDPAFADKRQEKYGPIFKTHLLGHPTVVMVGPEANRFILSSHMHHFSWEDSMPDTIKELFGRSLLFQDGEEHQRNRRVLKPAFHGKALEGYLETMERITQSYLTKWEAMGTFTWLGEMKQLTFEIASLLLLGSEPGAKTVRLCQWFSEILAGRFTIPLRFRWAPYGRALQARDRLLAHIEGVVRDRQQHPNQDALGLLVQSRDEEGNSLSMEEIKVQALLMLFAGYETTSSMLTSLVMSLAQNPTVWKQAQNEQDVLAVEGPLNLEQLRGMPYLEQVLKEVERLYPPVAGGFRGVIESFEFNGYQVPKGWRVFYTIGTTHKDPRCYSDIKQFDPDRFSPERAEHKKYDFSLVGFGGGPRTCLGQAFAKMEMKIVVAHLLRNYTWELLPDQDLTMKLMPTLHPRSGLKVQFRKRSGGDKQGS